MTSDDHERPLFKRRLPERSRPTFGGRQIRSYVLDRGVVKDGRTGLTSCEPTRVLDGDIDEFLTAALARRGTEPETTT